MAKTRNELPHLPYRTHNVMQVINHHRFAAPAGGVIILDDFTDEDNTALPAHTVAPINTPGASWSGFIPIFGSPTGHAIVGSIARLVSSGGTHVGASYLDAGVSDCVITANITVGSPNIGGSGLVFRVSDNANYWVLDLLNVGGGIRLYEVTGGVSTVRATGGSNPSVNTTYVITLTLSGDSITIVTPLGSISHNSSVRQTATSHGISSNNTGASGVKNFRVAL